MHQKLLVGRAFGVGVIVGAVMLLGLGLQQSRDRGGTADGERPNPAATPPADREAPREPVPSAGDSFARLLESLHESDGCLGTESARTQSGKNVLFAWFADKGGLLRWYYSDQHQGMVSHAFGSTGERQPLEHVPDDAGPIMVIASITMSKEPQFEGVSMPISQIAIELYEPLEGGLHLGGRFAPDEVEVEELLDMTPGALEVGKDDAAEDVDAEKSDGSPAGG